jgi:hypothetical protein
MIINPRYSIPKVRDCGSITPPHGSISPDCDGLARGPGGVRRGDMKVAEFGEQIQKRSQPAAPSSSTSDQTNPVMIAEVPSRMLRGAIEVSEGETTGRDSGRGRGWAAALGVSRSNAVRRHLRTMRSAHRSVTGGTGGEATVAAYVRGTKRRVFTSS